MTAGSPRAALEKLLRIRLLSGRYPPLHALRVLANLLVVEMHVTWVLLSKDLLVLIPGVADYFDAWFAMDLFFFLSGFLIASMLIPDLAAGRAVSVGRFYVRRTLRMAPAYYVVLLLLALGTSRGLRAGDWVEFLYLTNYAHDQNGLIFPIGWSLAIEEHFYLAAPVLVLALHRLRRPAHRLTALGGLWLLALLLRIWTYRHDGPWNSVTLLQLYIRTHLRFDILVAGVFTAYLQHDYGDRLAARLREPPVRRRLYAVSLAAFSVLLVHKGLGSPLSMSIFCWGTVTSFLYLPLFLLFLNHGDRLSRFLSHRVFAYAAALTYGVYLVHLPTLLVVVVPLVRRTRATVPAWILWSGTLLATFAASTLVAYLLHVTVEKASFWLRDRISPRLAP